MSNLSGVASSLKHVGVMHMQPDGLYGGSPAHFDILDGLRSGIVMDGEGGHWFETAFCKGNLTNLRRILHLSLAKGNPK
jgi:hypothetical protein